jgi:hypothetical protein
MKVFIYVALIILAHSCGKADCDNVKLAFYPDEYNLIVEQANIDLTWIKIQGQTPLTNKKTNIMVHNNWIVNSNEVEIGDTIVKRKGDLVLTIYKKDSIITQLVL